MRHMEVKYTLISAFIGGFFWFAIDKIESFFLLGGFHYHGIGISGLMAVILGTYIGLWTLGHIKRPSLTYGIFIGIISLTIYLSITTMYLYWIYEDWIYEYTSESIFVFLFLVISLVAGFIGTIIVRRTSPVFCPSCGNKLPSGRSPCPKCGTKV